MKGLLPTGGDNISSRLSIRYLLFYASAIAIGVLIAERGTALFGQGHTALLAMLSVPLAAIAAVFTISNTYLLLLTVTKGLYDAQLLFRITLLARGGHMSIFYWNLCFALVAASLVLFLLTATTAAKFSFESESRDIALILSKRFGIYLAEVALPIALSFVLKLLWQRMLQLIPIF